MLVRDHKHWTADDDTLVQELAGAGTPIDQIARQLGRRYGSVKWRIDHLALPPNRRQR